MEVEKPHLEGDDWVIIKVMATGICGTDVHVWQEKFQYWPPVILGHEFSGIIDEVGPACQKYKVGDRVVAEPGIRACGICEYCRSGRLHMCKSKHTLGWRTNGSFGEYVAVPEDILHRMPDTLSFEMAALCEPMAIAIYDVAEHGKINVNDFVVVQGAGPIGIIEAFVARLLGAGTVVLTGLNSSEYCRFDVARKLGVDVIINVQKENLKDRVMELTEGKGADCVIETSGAASAIAGSVDLLKRGGRLIGVGIPSGSTIEFPWSAAVMKDLEFYFNMSSSYTAWDKALGVLDRHKDVLCNLISRVVHLEDWEEVFESLAAEKDVKVVFTFEK